MIIQMGEIKRRQTEEETLLKENHLGKAIN